MAVAKANRTDSSKHPHGRRRSRVEMAEPATLGESIADSAAMVIGSWRFIIVQTILVAIWVVLNVIAWDLKRDPYPAGKRRARGFDHQRLLRTSRSL